MGLAATDSLFTILEYFDTAYVDNLAVGEELYGNKRELVLGGLKSTSDKIDEFLAFFPKGDIQVWISVCPPHGLCKVNHCCHGWPNLLRLSPAKTLRYLQFLLFFAHSVARTKKPPVFAPPPPICTNPPPPRHAPQFF